MTRDWLSPSDTRVLARRNLHVRHAPSPDRMAASQIVVGVALRNQAQDLPRCLRSICQQNLGGRQVIIVVLDDGSNDDWRAAAGDLLNLPNLVIVEGNCGSAARARNAILDFVDTSLPQAMWVARLDADDRFTSPDSLAAVVALGEQRRAKYVLGGNRLCHSGDLLPKTNPAEDGLRDPQRLLSLLEAMAAGTADNELPSCNLLLAKGAGWRYPDVSSAEDHWLVADLLINHPDEGVIVTTPFYCDYTLNGSRSRRNSDTGDYRHSRRALLEAAANWIGTRALPGVVLGCGGEGVVRSVDGYVEKRFHRGQLSEDKVAWLEKTLHGVLPFLPEPQWSTTSKQWCCRYPQVETTPVEAFMPTEVREFLLFCLRKGIVCANIKRENFRRWPHGGLFFVDIGEGIIPMNVDYFIDSAARLYAIGVLGWSDDELRRRDRGPTTETTLAAIPGFPEFYSDLLKEHAQRNWATADHYAPFPAVGHADDVSLLIKACAMDAAMLFAQVRSIVAQLETPRRFHERILAIDPFNGPFLRQHSSGDYSLMLREAERLQQCGMIDRVLVAPSGAGAVAEVNARWFGLPCEKSHSIKGVPVASQLWAFDQVRTRYVLQCDVDVLIGRRDLAHDYLGDMTAAAQAPGVLGVAFNIPHSTTSERRPYGAPAGEFVPEVRCGLLDLERVRACRPLPNSVVDGALALSWYRSLQQHQRSHGLRTLRGGDPRTFYVHPPNSWKRDAALFARVRDLVGQTRLPDIQLEHWDVVATETEWAYPRRAEQIVFLATGRNVPLDRVKRCLASLRMQQDQDFGVIIIDDASDGADPFCYPHLLGSLTQRTTLIRRDVHHGRMPNFITAIREICSDPDTLVVVLDLDDALFSSAVVGRLRAEYRAGADVILGAMFRPDKPTKLYHPSFTDVRANWGSEVWIHLRSFRKRLFDAIPDDALRIDGDWIPECTDYATMIPIVEMCQRPTYISEYLYFHERTTPRTPETRRRKDAIIRRILEKPSLSRLPATQSR